MPAPVAKALLSYHILEGVWQASDLPEETQRKLVVNTHLKPPVLTNVTSGAVMKLSRSSNGSATGVQMAESLLLSLLLRHAVTL